ncbi:hypothetical protein Y032_0152g2854 [Ancylostoma ceylanicum]|uniref:Uncharacterized protein n=1 Tax=Ancylostoma ceylanicum TaxID=53326 RepID=A0A016SZN1_9BILA|nr:hypothetical protein Y032_0152g2854 [Ancylostoma ceylanicum]
MRASVTRGGANKFHIPIAKLFCRRFSFIHRIIPQFEKLRKKRALPLSYNAFKTLLHGCPYWNPSWEPQFIMHATDPLSEEGMPTRIRDQQALVFFWISAYELCRANYTFLLTSQLFNVHRGVKRVATTMDSAVAEHQKRLRYRSVE